MGTDKRERQKANRSLKHQQELRQQRSAAAKRRAVRIGLIGVFALAGVVLIAWVGGAFDSDEAVTSPTAPPAATADPTDPDATPAPTEPPAEPTPCPPVDGVSEPVRQFEAPPEMCLEPGVTYTAEFTTNFGDFSIELDADRAPNTVNNFVVLARYRYYDDTICHRILPGFVIQCGDPTGTGTGSPGYRFADELPEAGEYEIGSVAMANSGPDTNGSQFFIITGERGAALPPSYSLFGEVVAGLDDVIPSIDAVGSPTDGEPPLEEVRIARVTITES